MKKKGSALILSILMLSFFMTITLTMYYIARNRNQRSIHKIRGIRIDSGLDSGSGIAHYELYLADEYVSRGHLYESLTPLYAGYEVDTYTTPPAITTQYATEEVTSGSEVIVVPESGKYYTGVVLNNYNEYFATRWDPTIGTAMKVASGSSITSTQAIQPWIAEDKVSTGTLLSRAWLNNTGEKIVRLWTETTGSAISVGGYRLIGIDGKDSSGNTLIVPLDSSLLSSTTSTSIKFTYEKIVSIDQAGSDDYRVTYTEEVRVTSSGSSIIIHEDKLESMTVEKLKKN